VRLSIVTEVFMSAAVRLSHGGGASDDAQPFSSNRLLAALRPDALAALSPYLMLADLAQDAVGQEIEAANVGREGAISGAARTLQDAGVIHISRGRMEILDRASLERRACERHDAIEAHFKKVLPKVEID
jgi:hypothetical protein